MDISVDCVGAMCPVPIVKAKIQYKKLAIGESVIIVTDHSCTFPGLQDAFKKFNCKVTAVEEEGIWEVTITKLG